MTVSNFSLFLNRYEQYGSKRTAKMYGVHQRTVQRWKKNGKIPDYLGKASIKKEDYDIYNQRFQARYLEAKEKGELKKFANSFGVNIRTIQRWKKDGLPKSRRSKFSEAKAKRIKDNGVRKKKGKKFNAVHGVVKFRVLYPSGQYADAYNSTKLYIISNKNIKECIKDMEDIILSLKGKYTFSSKFKLIYSRLEYVYIDDPYKSY